ncbi:MAG TPA: NUDIX hydrolase [Candidatus Limnocylindria bacterium]|nr:NUDIX hydrolase [Candidatus Limnocylindria bacterium]
MKQPTDPTHYTKMKIASRGQDSKSAVVLRHQDEFRLEKSGTPPQGKSISAVFALVFNEAGQLLVIRNERGWDIPGGHVEAGETPEEALHREVAEEAYATIKNARLYMSASADKSMLFYMADVKRLLPFAAEHETDQRRFMHPNELLGLYGGGKPELLTHVLAEAIRLHAADDSR